MLGTKPQETRLLSDIPRILPRHKVIIKPYSLAQNLKPFETLNDERFLAIQKHAFPVDLSDEKRLLQTNGYLEVTVPVQGLFDLFENSEFTKEVAPFARSFLIKDEVVQNPEHIMVTDIAGNQYEILLEEGKIVLPKEGVGLFSFISHVTFIYSFDQVDKLYMLAPAQTKSDFHFHISVSHLNANNSRRVKAIRQFTIQYQDLHIAHDQKMVKAEPLGDEYPGLYQIKMGILLLAPFLVNKQLIATIRLQENGQTKEDPFLHGWQVRQDESPILTKRFGLSAKTLTRLVKMLYTPLDLLTEYLSGGTLMLSQNNGYNNFLLRKEVLGTFYKRLVDDLINQKLPGKFLFERVSLRQLESIDLTAFSLDEHDSIVMSHLLTEVRNHRFKYFKDLFLTQDRVDPAIVDFFHIQLPGQTIRKSLPHVTLVVAQNNHSMNDVLESMQQKGVDSMSPLNHFEEEDFSTERRTSDFESTEKLAEKLKEMEDNFEGFDTTYRSRKSPWTTLTKRDKIKASPEEAKQTPRGPKSRP